MCNNNMYRMGINICVIYRNCREKQYLLIIISFVPFPYYDMFYVVSTYYHYLYVYKILNGNKKLIKNQSSHNVV